MAPKQKRSRASSSSSELNVDHWLYNAEAKTRYERMSRSSFFEGAFVKFEEFSAYGLQETANASGLHRLLSYPANNVRINHLLIKLFYANMGLDHHTPRNPEDCVWSMVCGVKIFLPVARLGHILQCTAAGPELDEIDVNMDIEARDEVTHRFLVDDIRGLGSSQLRPQARLLHRALIRSVTPRTGSYEEVRKINFQALYALYFFLRLTSMNSLMIQLAQFTCWLEYIA